VHLFVQDLFQQMRAKGQMGQLAILLRKDPKLEQFMDGFLDLAGST
jgi:hypothetical protein